MALCLLIVVAAAAAAAGQTGIERLDCHFRPQLFATTETGLWSSKTKTSYFLKDNANRPWLSASVARRWMLCYNYYPR